MSLPFFTIGHSDRSFEEFAAMLDGQGVELVVDVRKLPGSRRNPQFDEEALATALREHGKGYRRAVELGGRRPVARGVPPELNAFWENRSFHNYADYALSEEFRAGLERLREWGHAQRTAVMCSEAVWWRCHRRIIADHLLAQSESVFHIMADRRADPAQLTSGAVVGPGLEVTYPGQGSRQSIGSAP